MDKPSNAMFHRPPVLPPEGMGEMVEAMFKTRLLASVEESWSKLRDLCEYLALFDERRVEFGDGSSAIVLQKAFRGGSGGELAPFQVVSRFVGGSWRPGVRYGTVFDDFGGGPTPTLAGVGPLTLPLSEPAYFPGGLGGVEWLWAKVEIDDDDPFAGRITGITIERGHGETAPDAGGDDYFWMRIGWANDAGDTYSDLSGNMRAHRRGGPGAPYTVYPT